MKLKLLQYYFLDSLLAGKIGKKIKLTILQEGNITEAVITGLSYSQMSELKYDYQIAKEQKLVDESSNGKLGYIHIPAVENDWQKFYRDFVVDNFDKDALVIDAETKGRTYSRQTYYPAPEKEICLHNKP